MNKGLWVNPHIVEIQEDPFLKNHRKPHTENMIRLHMNELPYVHPKVEEAVKTWAENPKLNLFPHGEMTRLVEIFADTIGVKPENILLFPGSSPALDSVLRTFTYKDFRMVYRIPTYGHAYQTMKINGIDPIPVRPTPIYSLEIEEILEAFDLYDAHGIYLTNPHNPTGQYLPAERIWDILDTIPDSVPLIIDETYVSFADTSFIGAADLIENYPNLIILRSFSQAFGLASLRIGAVISHEDNIEVLRKIRRDIDITPVAQMAALEALMNIEDYERVWEEIENIRDDIRDKLLEMDIVVYPSETNFLLLRVAQPDKLSYFLEENGILVRVFAQPSWMTGHMRISISWKEDMDKLLRTIAKAPKEYIHS
jgi:histidinol-phosphate aminotransferase